MGARRVWALALVACFAPLLDCGVEAYCVEGTSGCFVPGCHDTLKNGSETDVDCGGTCAPCVLGKLCTQSSDCGSDHCADSHCCESPCPLWTKTFGGIVDDSVASMVEAPDGSIFVSGVFQGAIDFGQGALVSKGQDDAFVAKLSADGTPLWAHAYGGPLEDMAPSLVTTPEGHVIGVLSSSNDSLNFGGGAHTGTDPGGASFLFELDENGEHVTSSLLPGVFVTAAIARTKNGDLILSGTFGGGFKYGTISIATVGGYDIFAMRISPTGDAIRWGKRLGGIFSDSGNAVALGPDDSVYLGMVYSTTLVFGSTSLSVKNAMGTAALGKLDSNGKPLWAQAYLSPENVPTTFRALSVDANGSAFICGTTSGSIAFGNEILPGAAATAIFAAKVDPQGNTLWAHTYSQHSADCSSVLSDGAGGMYLAGVFRGDLDFGNGVTLTTGIGYPFVAHLDSDGNALWARAGSGASTSTLLAQGKDASRLAASSSFSGTFDFGVSPHKSSGGLDVAITQFAP